MQKRKKKKDDLKTLKKAALDEREIVTVCLLILLASTLWPSTCTCNSNREYTAITNNIMCRYQCAKW